MNEILGLTKRNLLMFFRNKAEVFFSFLSVIIILGLYVLFLSDLQVTNIKTSVGDVPGLSAMVNSWVVSGLIAVSTVTVALGALGRIVADRQNNSINDFLVSPIRRSQVFISYILSTVIITLILSVFLIVVSEIYILSSGGVILNFIQILKVLGITLICVLSSSLTMLFFISFVKSEQVMAVFNTIVGTLIGFITGAYVPVGIMPNTLQIISNLIPVSQGASLLRKVFLEQPMSEVFAASPKALNEYTKMQGIDLYLGDYQLSSNFMIMFIIGSIILFTILNIIRFKKMKNM